MKSFNLLLLAAALGAALPAQAASYNCKKARSYSEKLVCADAELSALDDSLEAARKAALATTRDKRAFRKRVDEKWLEREKGCQDRACVLSWYQTRIGELRGEATGALSEAAAAINQKGHAAPAAKAAIESRADTAKPVHAPMAETKHEPKPAASAHEAKAEGAKAAPAAGKAASMKADAKPAAAEIEPAVATDTKAAAVPVKAVVPAADAKPAEAQQSQQDIQNAKTQLDKFTLDVAWELFNEMKVAGTAFVPMGHAPLPSGICPTEVLDKRAHDDFVIYRFNCDMQTVRFQPKGGEQLDLTLFARAADRRRGEIDFNRNCVLKIDGVEMAMVLCKEVGKPGFYTGYRNSLREAIGKALASR